MCVCVSLKEKLHESIISSGTGKDFPSSVPNYYSKSLNLVKRNKLLTISNRLHSLHEHKLEKSQLMECLAYA
jgi:hypothetical protein